MKMEMKREQKSSRFWLFQSSNKKPTKCLYVNEAATAEALVVFVSTFLILEVRDVGRRKCWHLAKAGE